MCCSLGMKPWHLDKASHTLHKKINDERFQRESLEVTTITGLKTSFFKSTNLITVKSTADFFLLNLNNVYWTAVTRSGCATQMAGCFHKSTPIFELYDTKPSFPMKGGSCVAAMFYQTPDLQTKVFACESNLYLACEGSAKSLNVPRNKLYSFGTVRSFRFFAKRHFWTRFFSEILCLTVVWTTLLWGAWCVWLGGETQFNGNGRYWFLRDQVRFVSGGKEDRSIVNELIRK